MSVPQSFSPSYTLLRLGFSGLHAIADLDSGATGRPLV